MAVAKKKKVIPRRPKTGLGAVPFENPRGWEAIKYYFHYELDKKDIVKCLKNYVKANYSKDEAKIIGYNPEYKFSMYTHFAATAYMIEKERTDVLPENGVYQSGIKKYCDSLLESGRELEAEKKREEELKGNTNVVVLTPQQRMQNKVNQTIMSELMDLEDEWMDGQKTEFDMYNRMRFHDIKGAGVEIVRRQVESWYSDYYDAYHKKCDQAVEGYAHVKRTELNRRIKVCETMLEDLDKIKIANKATRKPRVKKPRAADKQVAKVKYLQESAEYKVVSISPMQIVGAMRLFVFNAKTRVITEYVTDNVKGFEVSGTTIKKFDPDLSRQTRLRKPEEFLPLVLGKTPKQIDNAFKSLTTKISKPNGRLNADTVILRAMDR